MPLSLRVRPSRGLWTLVALLLGLLFLTMETYRDLRPSSPAPSLSAAERQEASHKRFPALRMAQQAARLPGLAATEGGQGRLIPADISGPAFEPPLDAIRGDLAARLRRRFRPAGLDEALAAQEQSLIEELRANQEQNGHPSAYENKVRRLAEDRAVSRLAAPDRQTPLPSGAVGSSETD